MDEKYSQAKDAFTYLVRPHRETGSMIVTHKVTAGLSIKQSDSVEDDAIERLQASLAAASGASKVNGSGLMMELNEEDPEDAKRQALAAQKKIDAERRKAQAAADRENARAGRMGRSGISHARYSGLNVGMLEDDEEGAGRHGPSPNKSRGNKPRRRRNSEYSEDEDFGRRNFQNDEYDRDDGFVADSDEEEVVDDDDDPDDGIVEEVHHRRDRERTPKRAREAAEDEDDEADAPGEEDEEVQMARTKRRRVVDDEDEEE
jgi:RNA polymerase-associated protein LEO1